MRDKGIASPPRVAVVEDEDDLRHLIVEDLRARGCATVGLGSAEALYRHMSVQPVDVVVLDVGLPGESGYAAAAHLRQLATVGIIILTARGGAKVMARALADGADLFLTKPLDFEALGLGVANLHRRLHTSAPAVDPTPRTAPASPWKLVAGGWTLRSPAGKELPLQESERVFLQTLFEHAGTTVSRETLIAALTDQPQDFDPHRLEVLLHRLRLRAQASFDMALPVRAVRGAGYVLIREEH